MLLVAICPIVSNADTTITITFKDQILAERMEGIVKTKADENAVNAGQGDKEGIVEIGRDVEGVEVSVFVTESNKGIKCSLRSNEYVNVSDICLAFGGGGHVRAAGFSAKGNVHSIVNKIGEMIEQQYNEDNA